MDATQQLIWDPEEQEEEQKGSDREPRGRIRMFAGSQRAETDFLVYGGLNVIGRNESCQICIPVQSVSKKHAVIEVEGDSHLIHDCNSLNSTRRKNTILKPFVRYQINDGDLFLFGDVACQYLVLPPAAQDVDSGSETDSESMLPQSRACAGTDRREELTESDPMPEAASSDLESADDSLVLSPTQSYQHKLPVQVVQSDIYVKESEDDDTPWKESRSFSSRAAQDPNISAHQTPSANVVPESDDEAETASPSNVQPAQLHYNSDKDLEEDQRPGEEQAEQSTKQPADEINPCSETGAVAEQDLTQVTGDAVLNNLSTTNEMASNRLGEAVEQDTGAVSSQGLVAPPSADVQPRLNASEEEVKKHGVANAVSSAGPTEANPGLLNGTDTQEVAVTSSTPEDEVERRKANYCASNSPCAQEEAKETVGSLEEMDGMDADCDAEVDDDTSEFYALQPTQCFVLTVSSTQDETPGNEKRTTDDANTEEEATQVYSCDCPSFNQEPLIDDPAAAPSNTEEEGTQPFTFQSPTFGKDHFKSDPVTTDSLEEDDTQPFNLQSPVFSKEPSQKSFTSGSDPGKPLGQGEGVPGAGSSKEEKDTQPLVTEATDAAAPLRGRPSEPCEQERGGPEVEERWADEETQPFCTHEGAVEEEERAGEPEEAPASLGEVHPGDRPTLGPAGSPQRTGGGSRTEPAAEVGEGGSQTLPEHGGRASPGEAAGPDAESSRAVGRVGKRRGRAKPRAAGSDPSARRQEEAPVPGAGSGEEPSREARPSRRKSQQPGREEGTETPTAEETPTRPKRGRGRQKSSSQSATTADDHLCPPDQSPQDPPQRKGRRRSVAAPQEVTPQTESPPQQQPTGRGRRTQECTQPSSQEAELSSGRLRRSRAVSQPDSGKETTPQQIKTRRQACQLSPSSSSASLPESLTLPKVMFTGLVDEDGMKVIMQLGGEVVECVHDSTHLVTDRIRRTVKFLCAVARGIPVVTPEWLRKSGKNSYFLSPRSFLLDDRDQEQNFNFKLKDSLQKAKEQPLLRDYRIHVTAGVQPNPSQMGTILRCSGATVLPKMPRAYKEKTLVISCPGDLPKCKAAHDAGIPVVNAEFILTGILQQTVDVVKYRLDGDEVVDSKPEGKGRKRASAAAASTQPAAAKKKKKR